MCTCVYNNVPNYGTQQCFNKTQPTRLGKNLNRLFIKGWDGNAAQNRCLTPFY